MTTSPRLRYALVFLAACSDDPIPNVASDGGVTVSDGSASFALSASSVSLSVIAGQAATVKLTLVGAAITQPVTLTISGAPTGVTTAFDPAQTTSETTLTVTAASTAAAMTTPLVVTAQYGTYTATATVNLTVVAPFTATVDPTTTRIGRGQPAVVAVRVTRASGFTTPVAVTLVGAPDGVTAAPLTIDGAATSGALTLSATALATLGMSSVTVRAAAAGTTVDSTLGLEVREAPGTLDTTYGTNGFVKSGALNDVFGGWSVQSDGKFVGYGRTGVSSQVGVARYLASGALDTSFNTTGIATYTVASATPRAVATQAAGILFGGSFFTGVATDGFVARFTPAGVLDTTFGTSGKFSMHVASGAESIRSIALDGTGRILVLANTSVQRYSANGVLDATFGTAGTASFTGINGSRVIPLTGDAVLVVGTNAGYADMVAYKLTSGGLADMTFGTMGSATVDVAGAGDDVANAAVQQPDGKIVLFGQGASMAMPGSTQFAFVRLTAAGVLDTTFATTGKLQVGAVGDRGNDLYLQPDGKIVGAGYGRYTGGVPRGYLVRVNTDGTLDPSFGVAGKVYTDFGAANNQEIVRIFPTAGGRLSAVGQLYPAPVMLLATYWL